MSATAGVLGATGATGGELLRLLDGHPDLDLAWASSRRQTGVPVSSVHPHLAGSDDVRFEDPATLPDVDVLFCATPHGTTAGRADELAGAAELVVDLSSDFRLDDPGTYEATYGREHPTPERLTAAAYGLPELDRTPIREASWIAGPGCLATAAQLALAPLAREGLLGGGPVVVDGKIGSTAGGTGGGRWSAHAARSSTVRPYAPTGHRHEAEVRQNCFDGDGTRPLWFSAHAVDMPRGILVTAHVPTRDDVDRRALHRALLGAYNGEPFVDVLAGRARPGGVPEPRFVAGTNRAQVAALARDDGGAVVLCAIDNLGKGAAGSAVQSTNLNLGIPETRGLEARAAFP